MPQPHFTTPTLRYTALHFAALHYTTLQIQIPLPLHLELQLYYNYTTTTCNFNSNYTTLQLELQLHHTNHYNYTTLHPAGVHPVRVALPSMHRNNQTSPISFLSLKLPPQPGAVLHTCTGCIGINDVCSLEDSAKHRCDVQECGCWQRPSCPWYLGSKEDGTCPGRIGRFLWGSPKMV